MKQKLIKICFVTALVLTAGCCKYEPSQDMSRSSNPAIPIELMLVHEGIKVYRFCDGFRYIYFTDARGVTEWTQQEGKVQVPVRVETVR